MFEGLLLIIAKIGFIIFVLLFTFRWLFVIPYIWFKYDSQIIKLKKELDEYKKNKRKEPIIQQSIEGAIKQKEIRINEKLDLLETQRKLFIDRVNLFLSISSINKN